ncbi:RNA 3'-terminal phosphate cyclase [Crenothrix polyspora]|nr:RNA 3'-terminal phosphate cyclase [Crenothrix polyspora]
MNWRDEQLLMRGIDSGRGPGNAMLLTFEHDHVTEVFTGFGEKGLFADTLAKNTVAEARRYLSSNAVVGTYLADQLLLPMALAGGGSFTSTEWSQHAVSNAEVIQQFLPVAIVAEKTDSRIVRVNVVAKD